MTIEVSPTNDATLTQKPITDPQLSLVYVLTNSAMPGLVKIGFTGQDAGAKSRSEVDEIMLAADYKQLVLPQSLL